MAHGTMHDKFPGVHRHDGSKHPAHKNIDFESNTNHEHLQHVGGEVLGEDETGLHAR